jgi:mRNA-degrading endonuclease toxin of MazEF toxin-antitoxin module
VDPIRPRRGEVWDVDTPNRPDDPHQPRPAIIISANVRNELRDHVIVAPVYSRGTLGPTHLGIRGGIGGLEHDSVIFCEEITTLDRRFFRFGPLGPPIPEAILRAIIFAVRAALDDDTLVMPP